MEELKLIIEMVGTLGESGLHAFYAFLVVKTFKIIIGGAVGSGAIYATYKLLRKLMDHEYN